MSAVITNQRLFQVFAGLLLLTITICCLLIWLTRQGIDSYVLAKADFSALRDSVFREVERSEYLSENLQGFREHKSNGKIGVLNRIVWVDVLEGIGDSMELSEFNYEMSPSMTVKSPLLQHVELQVVNIKLTIGFAHDGEIFEYFSALSEGISATYEVAGFDVVRVKSSGADNVEDRGSAALKVVCDINWYSVIVHPEKSRAEV